MEKIIKDTIHANGIDIGIYTQDFENEFISLTDIARYKSDDPTAVIQNWMRNRDVIEFLGIWERLHNPDFKPLEFDVHPKIWTQIMEAHFNMSKLTREQKIEIYEKRKLGKSIQELSKEYHIRKENIKYLIRLIDRHGSHVVHKDKNKYYPPELKEEMVNKVLIENHSIKSTAIEYGLSSAGLLHNWIRSYKENGYVIIERKQGRPQTMKTNQPKKKYEEMTLEEKNAYNEERILYLEAENEYLKKLRAVVQARKNRLLKKK